jgi:L-lactate dehydrogenase complex protein LldG
MNARDEIFARLRAEPDPSATLPPLRSPAMVPDDAIALFVERAERVGIQVVKSTVQTWVDSAVGELQRRGIRSAAIWDDPLLSPLAAAMEASGIELVFPDRHTLDRLAEVAAGITTADAAIALSGTMLLACDAQRPRSTSLLPPLHVAVLPADRIVATLGHVFQVVKTPLPSALTFITGPSRSSDIELTPVKGAHGPTEVIAYLIMEE